MPGDAATSNSADLSRAHCAVRDIDGCHENSRLGFHRTPVMLAQLLWLAVADRVVSSFGVTATVIACALEWFGYDARGSP